MNRCEILATVSGLVIYKEVFFGSEKRRVQVGDQVWPNQPLIMLPDLSQMTVETQVRETDIYKVEKNQQVLISVEAYPELTLEGEVSFIGTLAQEDQARRGGKYFTVSILVKKSDPRLRPGMSARVELLVERLEKAHYVPLEAVFVRGGRHYVYVMRGRSPEVQEVLVGPQQRESHRDRDQARGGGPCSIARSERRCKPSRWRGSPWISRCRRAITLRAPELLTALARAVDVHRIYPRARGIELSALGGVSLDIERGSFVAIVGRSGSGKSTLMNLLGCLDQPTRGQILLEGKDAGALDDKAASRLRSRLIGFLFQSFNLIPQMTVLENVETALLYSGRPESEWRERSERLLDRLGILDRSSHRPTELSGGEAQRAALARALVNDPELLLADEPTGNLDSRTGEEVLALLEGLVAEGRTLVLVTHDASIAARADRVIELSDGRLVRDSATDGAP